MENEIIIGDSFESTSLMLSNENAINLKMLIPSCAAGAIIGKGGESIGHIQKDTGSRIRMTKLNDFYPGTSERVCLITGSLEAVRKVIYFIMDKIKEKPAECSYPRTEEKLPLFELSRQIIRRSSTISNSSTTTSGSLDGTFMHVKILVPNSTAGRIIGKGGQYVEQIKEETGAYVQISQKSRETKLPERCVTIAGDLVSSKKAIDLILHKIVEDPYSRNFTTLSYAGYPGPIANASPTGSPFANSYTAERNDSRDLSNNLRSEFGDKNSLEFSSMGNLNINSILNSNLLTPSSLLDNLKMTLRNLGYSELAIDEITSAYNTLSNYGCLPHVNSVGILPNMLNTGSLTSYCSNTISNLGKNRTQSSISQNSPFIGNSTCRDNLGSQYGPIGSNSETFSSTHTTGSNDVYSIREKVGLGSIINNANYHSVGFPCNSSKNIDDICFSGMNNNSFGLGLGLCGPTDKPNITSKQEIEVPETIVGAILGPKGKGIVEIQQLTNAVVQISKRGVYAPGTRNRLVDISGTPLNVAKAQFLIQQRLQQEETKRSQQTKN
ncbi:RNA-binding protein Pasilla-like isoform X7 [Octopus vulgaris]|uniref:RNA-binding protein Pasilla-like isoform X7 n=1 Tax=Octopus vulgaris TaxID=6645 RepID=A0AA36BE49_OCTVU|nr:RNA-binding protein Pasilla-like isoform X7 [Octopus vulgaris]